VVLNEEPTVSISPVPDTAGVQEYQTEWPPFVPRICGSPGSRVALIVAAVVAPPSVVSPSKDLRGIASAKLSFRGGPGGAACGASDGERSTGAHFPSLNATAAIWPLSLTA